MILKRRGGPAQAFLTQGHQSESCCKASRHAQDHQLTCIATGANSSAQLSM